MSENVETAEQVRARLYREWDPAHPKEYIVAQVEQIYQLARIAGALEKIAKHGIYTWAQDADEAEEAEEEETQPRRRGQEEPHTPGDTG